VHPTIYKILDKYQEHNESLRYDYKKFSEPQLRKILRLNRDEKMTVQELQSNLTTFMDKLQSYEDKTKIALCAKEKLARKKHKIHDGNSPDLMMADEGILKDVLGSQEFTGIIDELPALKTDIQEAIEASLKNLGRHKD
jgi:superfamily I DNA and/or RNA helicase